MRTVFRYLLWILIMAVPLQGGAVAFMNCAAAAAGSQPAAHHGDAAQLASAHEGHCKQAADTGAGGTHLKCSHCASCFVGPAAPPSMPSLQTPATFSTFAAAAVEATFIGHIPATLERPPRVLA
jgi:hypothetical protein